jgi:hypothetical protein
MIGFQPYTMGRKKGEVRFRGKYFGDLPLDGIGLELELELGFVGFTGR